MANGDRVATGVLEANGSDIVWERIGGDAMGVLDDSVPVACG